MRELLDKFKQKFEWYRMCLPKKHREVAATLLALGADEIIMHPFSNLGPVDPQFLIPDPYNKDKRIFLGAEDLKHYIDFARNDVGISDQEQIEKVFELICKDVNPTTIGMAKRGSHLTCHKIYYSKRIIIY